MAQVTHVIQVSDFVFNPASVTGVKIGDTIEWDWVSGDHTVTSVTIPGSATTFNFSMTSSSAKAKYAVKVSGTYNYQCSFHAADGMVGSFVVDAATSISTNVYNELRIEPNPAHDYVIIKMNGNLTNTARINVFDLLGRKVLSSEEIQANDMKSYTMDISSLNEGIYLLMINSGSISSKPFRMIKR
jgi:plastocyanin